MANVEAIIYYYYPMFIYLSLPLSLSHTHTGSIFITYRLFCHPQPDMRSILDNVSDLISAINRSLSLGTVRMHTFSIDFNFDIFRFLFSNKGKAPSKGKGLLYDRCDFASEYFTDKWDVVLDRLGDGCKVEFPIRLRPVLKFSKKCYVRNGDGNLKQKPRTFYETLSVTVFKHRC